MLVSARRKKCVCSTRLTSALYYLWRLWHLREHTHESLGELQMLPYSKNIYVYLKQASVFLRAVGDKHPYMAWKHSQD